MGCCCVYIHSLNVETGSVVCAPTPRVKLIRAHERVITAAAPRPLILTLCSAFANCPPFFLAPATAARACWSSSPFDYYRYYCRCNALASGYGSERRMQTIFIDGIQRRHERTQLLNCFVLQYAWPSIDFEFDL